MTSEESWQPFKHKNEKQHLSSKGIVFAYNWFLISSSLKHSQE